MNTKQGGRKLRETMIKKHGSEEAWKQWLREQAAKGGKGAAGTFKHDRKLAARAGRKGGRKSKRKVN